MRHVILTIAVLTCCESLWAQDVDNPVYADLPEVVDLAPASYRHSDRAPLVAVYYDSGVWRTGYTHVKYFLREYEYSYDTINSSDIDRGYLAETPPAALIMPGGASWTYLDDLGESGGEAILDYVNNGGGYVGICAGAFYAASMREGGHTTGPYGIGLLDGTGYDGTALGTEPFKNGMLEFSIHVPGFAPTHTVLLLDGPSMLYTPEEAVLKEIEVIARFPLIGHPAMILFNYGAGRVFLTGPHPEIEEHLTSWSYRDPESDWPLLGAMLQRVLFNR